MVQGQEAGTVGNVKIVVGQDLLNEVIYALCIAAWEFREILADALNRTQWVCAKRDVSRLRLFASAFSFYFSFLLHDFTRVLCCFYI